MARIASELLNKKANKTDLELKADKTYVDEKISESKGYAFPDYSKKTIVKAVGADYNGKGYSAESDGWFYIFASGDNTMITYLPTKKFGVGYLVDGCAIGFQSADLNVPTSDCQAVHFAVKKDAKLTLSVSSNVDSGSPKCIEIYFIPCS